MTFIDPAASPPAGQQAEPTDEQIASMAAMHGICPPLVSYEKVRQFIRALFKLARYPSERWVRCEFCHQLTDRNRVDPLHPSERPAPEGQAVQRFNNLSGLMNPAQNGLYVRYEDHIAALAASQAERPAIKESSTTEGGREG